MSPDAWPSPDAAAPLPRLEDLPLADDGYEQEAVRRAFDAFYRHAAQLDASLRALEGVEAFRRDADALRNDLRALQALAAGGYAPEPAWARGSYERPRSGFPLVVLRLAAESALIVAIAVIAGVSHLRASWIVGLMAAAFVVVAFSEWLAARSRYVSPAVAVLTPAGGEPAPYVETPAPGWTSVIEPGEDTEPDDALTMVARAEDDGDADPWEHGSSEPA